MPDPAPDEAAAMHEPATGDTTITVTGPTIVAFYRVDRLGTPSPASRALTPHATEPLADFEYYLPRQQSLLAGRGWHFVSLYRSDFQATGPDGAVLARPAADSTAGYLVVRPDAPPAIAYGVMTDTELLAFVQPHESAERRGGM